MKSIVYSLTLLLLISCNGSHHRHSDTAEDSKESNHHTHTHDQGHTDDNHHDKHHATANDYMHQSSVQELIQRFESPERDAYQQPEKVLQYLGDLQGKTIMDIGAGSGYFSVKLASQGAKVIAADVNEEFQGFLQKRIVESGIQNIELRKIPHDSPNLNENEVDIVLIVNTYHHIEQRPEYFAKVKNGLKTEGSLVVIDYFKSDIPVGPPIGHKVSIDSVISELKEAGYTTFDVEVNILPYQFIIRAR